MKPQIPWLRVFVEGVVIVGSILLALAADAWWDGRQEQAEAERLSAALITDFEATRVRINESVARADSLLVRADGFMQAAAAPGSISRDSARSLIGGVTSRLQFAGALASYEASVESGSIGLLDNPRLVEALAEFRQAQAFWDEHERIHGEIFYLGPIWEMRREFGSLRALSGVGNEIIGTGPLPPGMRLTDEEFWTAIASPAVYSAVEVTRNVVANKRRALLELDAAALGVLDALTEMSPQR